MRWGMVYRAGHPSKIPSHAHGDVAALGLACIVDLRSTRERLHEGYRPSLLENLEYWFREYDYSDADITEMLRNPASSAEEAAALMKQVYRGLPYEQAEGLAAMFDKLRAGRVPLLVNCSAGKDRTGTAVALLLSALGVPRSTVIADYVLSEQLHDLEDSTRDVDPNGPLAFMLKVSPAIMRALVGSPAEYLEEMFAAVEREHGSVEGYYRDVLKLGAAELKQLHNVLLEPAAAPRVSVVNADRGRTRAAHRRSMRAARLIRNVRRAA